MLQRFGICFHSSKYIYFCSSRIRNLNVAMAIFTGLHNYLFYGDGTHQQQHPILCISDVTDVFDVSISPIHSKGNDVDTFIHDLLFQSSM